MFVFGSSLVDNGNNHHVENATARADYLPYGIDFPLGPSGRFSNGKNVIDGLGDLLNLPLIPAFKHPSTKESNSLQGVNFASGNSGILDETGSTTGTVINLNQQIKYFEEVKRWLGSSSSLSNYLFVFGTGGNDLSAFMRDLKPTPVVANFTANLAQNLSKQIQKLYSLGARKFVLISVYPLGSIPNINNSLPDDRREPLNEAAQLFNAQMKSLVDDLKPKLPGSALVYVNSNKIITDIIKDPASKGFTNVTNPCCEVLLYQGRSVTVCKMNGHVSDDRRGHVFFDGVHPTEAVNVLIANTAFTSNLQAEVYPINVQQLVELQV